MSLYEIRRTFTEYFCYVKAFEILIIGKEICADADKRRSNVDNEFENYFSHLIALHDESNKTRYAKCTC